MAAVEVKVTITPDSIRYLKKLTDMPREVPGAVQRALDSSLQTIKQNVIQKRLSGEGPFPPDEHRLGVRTATLRGSVFTQTAISGNKVTGIIGSDVLYAPVHEFGAVISAVNAPFLVFKIKGQLIRTRSVVIPERAPFRTEVESDESAALVSGAIVEEVMALGSE